MTTPPRKPNCLKKHSALFNKAIAEVIKRVENPGISNAVASGAMTDYSQQVGELVCDDLIENEKEILGKGNINEISEREVIWRILNKKLIEHAQHGDWGLYRNTIFEMAEILRSEMSLRDALQTYLEVCYIDLNGPNNTGGRRDPELLRMFPPFDPKQRASIAPGLIDIIKRIIKRLKIDKDHVKSDFLEHNSKIRSSLKLPLTAEDCWSTLEKEI